MWEWRRYADILVAKEFWRSDEDWLKVYDKVVITMTNCLDGAYLTDTDAFSSMKYPYSDFHGRLEGLDPKGIDLVVRGDGFRKLMGKE